MNRPVAVLPEPFPDETLHSLITRYHLLAADRDDATTRTLLVRDSRAALFGQRGFSAVPPHVADIAREGRVSFLA